MSLESLREKIDSVDQKLIGLLNERAKVSIDIGKTKKSNSKLLCFYLVTILTFLFLLEKKKYLKE
jgi:chorismate mutase